MSTNLTIIGVQAATIDELLSQTLSPEQRAEVFLRPEQPDAFAPPERGAEVTPQMVIEFTAAAIAGGMIYDLVKAAALATFGRLKVKADRDGPDDVDPAT